MRHVTSPICALVLLLLCFTVATEAATMADFLLTVKAPQGWKPLSPTRKVANFGAGLLTGWEKQTDGGTAVLYVLGSRSQGQFLLSSLADSFQDALGAEEIAYNRYEGFTIAGRPAVKFAMVGDGAGWGIRNFLDEALAGTLTYMELAVTRNYWADSSGTDLVYYVMACPEPAKVAIDAAFKTLVHSSAFAGQYKAPKSTAPAARPTVEVPAPVSPGQGPVPEPAPKPQVSTPPTSTATGEGTKPAQDVLAPAVAMLKGAGLAVYLPEAKEAPFDLLAAGTGARQLYSVQVYRAQEDKAGEALVWNLPVTRVKTAQYVVLLAEKSKSAWLVPSAALLKRLDTKGDTAEADSTAMGEDGKTLYEFLKNYADAAAVLKTAKGK